MGLLGAHERRRVASPGRLRIRQWVILLLALCLNVARAPFDFLKAQDVRPLPIGAALDIKQFADLIPVSLSPDNTWVAYTVQASRQSGRIRREDYARTGIPPWASGTDIFLVNTKTGESTNLTGGNGDNWLPSWSPDGRCLAFLSTRDGSTGARLWIWDARNHHFRTALGAIVRTDQIEWTADSRKLLVTMIPSGGKVEPAQNRSLSNMPEHRYPGSSLLLYTSNVLTSSRTPQDVKSDPWDLDMFLRDLCSVDLATGRVITLVGERRIATFAVSPLGDQVVYSVPQVFEQPGSQQVLFDLRVVTLRGRTDRVLTSGIRLDYGGAAFRWSPNGSYLSFQTGGMNETSFDCYVIDSRRGMKRDVSSLPPSSGIGRSSAPVWGRSGKIFFLRDGALWETSIASHAARRVGSQAGRRIVRIPAAPDGTALTLDRGQSLLVVTHDDAASQDGFYSISLKDGHAERLLERGQCYTCANAPRQFVVSRDGERVVYFTEDAQHQRQLAISGAGFRGQRILTNLNPQFGEYKMGAVSLVDWMSDNGQKLRGALLLPSNYVEGRRYPLVVWVYGGSLLSGCLDHFGLAGSGPFNMQLLATRGYAVLVPDAPQRLGTPLYDLGRTVLPGVNRVIAMGVADADRLGVVGHSYGGYSVLSLIVQTDRFEAAVDIDGYGDLIADYGAMSRDGSAFGTSINESGQGLMGGTPWQFRDRYIENSPLFYLDRITSPLLIVQGESDTTVPPFLADEVFVDLRRLGKEVEYAKYLGEGHAPPDWAYADQMDFCKRLISWLDSHLERH